MNPLLIGFVGLAAGQAAAGPSMAVQPGLPQRPDIDLRNGWVVLAEWSGGYKLVRPLTDRIANDNWFFESRGASPVPRLGRMWWPLHLQPVVVLYLVKDDQVRAALVLKNPTTEDPRFYIYRKRGLHELTMQDRGILLWLLIDVLDVIHWTDLGEIRRLRMPATADAAKLEAFRALNMHDALERAINLWEPAVRVRDAYEGRRTNRRYKELYDAADRYYKLAEKISEHIMARLNVAVLGVGTEDRGKRDGVFIHGWHRPVQIEFEIDEAYNVVWWLQEFHQKRGHRTGVRPKDRLPELDSDHGDLLGLLAANDLLIATEAFDDWLKSNIIEPHTIYADLGDVYSLLGEGYPFTWPNNRYFAYIGWQETGA